MAVRIRDDVGMLKKIGATLRQTFYHNNRINYRSIIIASSSLLIGGYILKTIINAKKENRITFNKFYYRTHASSLRYINLLLRVHLPLSINSIFIISHLRYIKQKGELLDYNDIKSGYKYGILNYIITLVINRLLNQYIYKSFSDDITIKIFEKYILSPAESKLVIQMNDTNKILREKLGSGVENIKDLENIIWEYIGPINDAVDYTEFKEIINYVHVLKKQFTAEQKAFDLHSYLMKRAINMFDWRPVVNLSIWKMKHNYKYRNGLTILFNITAQFLTYLARFFGTMTLSQIWSIIILELSGNHDLLDQYLYSLMSREPLYLYIGFPFFVLRFTRFRADKLSGAFKDWIVVNVKDITHKLFGAKGFRE